MAKSDWSGSGRVCIVDNSLYSICDTGMRLDYRRILRHIKKAVE
jgi:hypothetical protein